MLWCTQAVVHLLELICELLLCHALVSWRKDARRRANASGARAQLGVPRALVRPRVRPSEARLISLISTGTKRRDVVCYADYV